MSSTPNNFIPGLELAQGYYADLIRPLLDKHHPGLEYAAGLLGHCSDALGVDTPVSMDHVWGPRLQIFLREHEHPKLAGRIEAVLRDHLPPAYRGFPTHFQSQPGFSRWARMEKTTGPPINAFVEIETVRSFLGRDLDWDTNRSPTLHEWLTFPEQALVEATCGRVFHDDVGDLTKAREMLQYWPRLVRLFRMWCLWRAIDEERAFPGRCNDLGDALGERIITARIASKLMRLWFLISGRYCPYSKWIGTVLLTSPGGEMLACQLQQAIAAPTYAERESGLCDAYRPIISMHNQSGLTPSVRADIGYYFDRPYRCLLVEPVTDALKVAIGDDLDGYDWELLSKTVLSDESSFAGYKRHIHQAADAALRSKS